MKLLRLKSDEEIMKGIDALTSIFIEEYPYYSKWISKNQSQFKSGEKTIFSVHQENELVGYLMVHYCSENIAKLNGIYIFEEYKGKGYATRAVDKLVNLLQKCNLDLLYVQTRLNNNAVVHLLDKVGFELIGTNYHEVEEKDNWVACCTLNNKQKNNIKKEASIIYDGYKPLTEDEVKDLREKHKDGNLVLKLRK